MTLAELTAKMKEGASKKSAFGNTVKFATDQGVVYIDGNQTPPVETYTIMYEGGRINTAILPACKAAALNAIPSATNRQSCTWYAA